MYNLPVRLPQLKHAELLIPGIALAARLVPGPRTIDDAYITFRYAQNLLEGQGLVYNPGEAVLGTTTPTYALLLAGLALLFGGSQAPFQLLALIVNAVADGLTCWMLPKLGERMGSRLAGSAAALIWAIAPWSVTFAIGGMETSLLVALATGTFYNHLSRQPVWAAFTGSLALLTRPDSLLFLLPLAGARMLQVLRPRKARSETPSGSYAELLAFGLPVGGWAIAGTALYRSPIPHSIFAKAAAYHLRPEAGLVRLLQHYGTPFLGHNVFGEAWIGVGLLLYPTLFLLGFRKTMRVAPGAWPIMIYPWLYFAAYAIANPLLFRWYLTPPLPAYWLGIFLGVERISDDLRRRLPTILLMVIALAFGLNAWVVRPDHGPQRPAPEMAYIELELLYAQAAERLDGRIESGQVLGAADIGALGYFTQARILDLLGLVSPEATAYYPAPAEMYAINYAIPPDLVADLKPDYLILLEAYGRNGLLQSPSFLASHTLIETLPTDIYGSRGLLIYARNSGGS